MKKILITIVAILLAIPSSAQYSSGGFTLNESTLYYGARIGMTVSTLTGDDTDDLKSKTGLTLGAVIGLRVSEESPVFLESGLYYTQYGAKGKGKGKNEINLHYLEIPILIKYGFKATEDIAILPYIGPTLALGIGGRKKTEDINGDVESFASFGSGNYNRPNVGIKIGCGAEWHNLYIEAGYHIGVTNAYDSEKITQYNGNFFANIGVNF